MCLLGDVAEVGDFRLQSPVPIVLLEELVLVEESDGLMLASSVREIYLAVRTLSRSGTCGDSSPCRRT